MNCNLIPTVEIEGTKVPSALFTTLQQYSNNREEAKNLYLYTKTKEFQDWNPKLDNFGEAIVEYYNEEPVFVNTKNEVKPLFEKYYSPDIIRVTAEQYEQATGDPLFGEIPKKQFSKLLQQKQNVAKSLHRIINLSKGDTPKEITKVETAKKLLYGTKNEKGLEREIAELTSDIEVKNVIDYATHTLNQIKSLVDVGDFDSDTLALELANFLERAGSFIDMSQNPLFEEDELANMNEQEKSILADLAFQASNIVSSVKIQSAKNIYERIIDDPTISKKIDKKKLTEGYVFSSGGLKDISLFDEYLMDPASITFGETSPLGQVMKITLENAFNRSKGEVKFFEERLNNLLPTVEKTISSLEDGKYQLGSMGIQSKGVVWDIFYETDSNGKKTGNLVNRYSSKWFDEFKHNQYLTNKKIVNIWSTSGTNKSGRVNAALNEQRKWIKNNSIILDFTAIPQIMEYINNHPVLKELNIQAAEEEVNKDILNTTDKHFEEIVEEQIKLLEEYANKYNAVLKAELIKEEVESFDDLSGEGKTAIQEWILKYSPMNGYSNFVLDTAAELEKVESDEKSYVVFNTFDYNVKIPRKIKSRLETRNGKSVEIKKETNYYNDKFNLIEQHDDLYQFRNLANEILTYVNSALPTSAKHTLSHNAIPLLHKNLSEIMFDPKIDFFAKLNNIRRYLYDYLRKMVTIDAPDNVTKSTLNPLTGEPEKRVNDSFLRSNKKDISIRFNVEKAKFNSLTDNTSAVIKDKYTVALYETLSQAQLTMLRDRLNFNFKNKNELYERLGLEVKEKIPVGKILYNYSTDYIIDNRSYNLHKSLLLFTQAAADYKARSEVKPFIDAAMEKFKEIKKIETGRTNEEKINESISGTNIIAHGSRKKDVSRYESWYDRVVLGNYQGKDTGVTDKKIHSYEEKLLLKELDNLEGDDIENLKKQIGTNLTATRFWQAILTFIRMKALGWNLPASLTNLLEGQISNELLAQTEEFFSLDNWYKATNVYAYGSKEDKKKMKVLMNKFDILQDSSNMFQKAEIKSALSKLNKLSPFQFTRTVEWFNQSPLMVALLMEEKIKDSEGNEVSLWNAFDENGHLKKGFSQGEFGEQNIQNWEKLDGSDYNNYKNKQIKVIVKHHGDYDANRGIKIKETYSGKSLLMFKGWLPMYINKFFADQHLDFETGKTIKGYYRSQTRSAGSLSGFLIGMTVGGLPMGAFLGLAGYGLSVLNKVDSDSNYLQTLLIDSKSLAKKLYGIPLNRLAGRKIVNTSTYQEYKDLGFTELDARNLQANLSQMSILLTFVLMSMMVKAALWDDEDDKDSNRRKAHNLLMNKLGNLIGQITMYTQPQDFWNDMVAQNGVVKAVSDVIDVVGDVSGYIQGVDTYSGGYRSGESKLATSFSRAFLPVPAKMIINQDFSFGFDAYMKRQFETNWIDYEFSPKEEKLKEIAKSRRSKRRKELLNEGLTLKEANKILRKEGFYD